MSKREKRLQKLRNNIRNVSFEQLQQVLEDHGFTLQRSSGSHHSFGVMIKGEYRLFVVPYRKPVKAVYIKAALELIDIIRSDAGDMFADDE